MCDFLTKAIEGGGASGPLRRELKRLQAENEMLKAELAECREQLGRLIRASEAVVATAHGNSYGLTIEDVLEAQLLAAKEIERALGKAHVKRILAKHGVESEG